MTSYIVWGRPGEDLRHIVTSDVNSFPNKKIKVWASRILQTTLATHSEAMLWPQK